MKKATYILIYAIILSRFFDVIPFGYLNSFGRGIAFDIIGLLWLGIGYRIYPKSKMAIDSKFTLIFYISIIPSFFMAKTLFGQSLLSSLITSRALLTYLAIPTLFHINPSPRDIIKASSQYTTIFIIICLCRTFIPIKFFIADEKQIQYMADSGDFLNRPIEICVVMILLSLYYYSSKLFYQLNTNYIIKTFYYFVILLSILNRSTLFPTLLILGYTIIFSKWKDKALKSLIITFISIISIILLVGIIAPLIDETTSQVQNTGDPRIIAFAYFFNFDQFDIKQLIFGTGNISFQTSSYVEDLQNASIHYSDVGIVGFWSIYGIIPSIIILFYIIKGLFSNVPLYVKYLSFTSLICSLTVCYFNNPCRISWFVLYFYLLEYYLHQNNSKKHNSILTTS